MAIMPTLGIAEGIRNKEVFWYPNQEALTLEKVIGFETPEPEVFWCPEKGYSLWIDKDLFRSEEAARKALRTKVNKEFDLLKDRERLIVDYLNKH